MSITNFPAALQPLIQTNMLQRGFQMGLKAKLEYRGICDKMGFPIGIGQTLTATRSGYLPAITTPANPAQNTNLDNGMTPEYAPIEQYTISINQYQATQDLDLIGNAVGAADQFLRNAYVGGEQAARSLDSLARNALFDGYLGGNTRVRTTLGAPGTVINVDDIRGFSQVLVNGQYVTVSSSNTLPVVVDDNEYSLISVGADATNVSTTFGGISGTLTFSTNVTVNDGTQGNAVISRYAPRIFRPDSKETYVDLVAGDYLTMALLQDSVAYLRDNAVPDLGGFYNCYLDNRTMTQLYRDPEFRELFRGGYKSDEYKNSVLVELLGLRFITTTQAPVQSQYSTANAVVPGLTVRRTAICGADTLIEGVFDGQMGLPIEKATGLSYKQEVDGVVMVVRPPLDRNSQLISQTWYSVIGYVAPTDATANSSIINTASNAYLKRSVVIESLS